MLLTRDEATSDAVLAAASALGVKVEVLTAVDQAIVAWADASLVLIGGDCAGDLAALGPKRRPGVVLVGPSASELGRWSVPLGGQVIVLPQGLASLSAVLASDDGRGAPMVAVVGGSGGIGASTLAAGLAVLARKRGVPTALVDLDPVGGGIDLLLGAERTPGWRWPRLVGARGEVTDVRRFLPQVDGLTVVSMGRAASGEGAPTLPSSESVRAVLGALARHHGLVVLDVGRTPMVSARPSLALCARTLVMAGSGVREVAAASGVLAGIEVGEPAVVVRPSSASGVPPDVVGKALGLPVIGVVPTDRALARGAEVGDTPGRSGRGRWAKAVSKILTALEVGR